MAFTKCGKMNEALALSRKMEAEGCDQTVYTFTILIARLFTEHRDEEALRLWDVMIDKGISPNAASIRFFVLDFVSRTKWLDIVKSRMSQHPWVPFPIQLLKI